MKNTKKMITAVTLNPCIDRTIEIPPLVPGEHHVASKVMENIGGKGINVNVVLKHLGLPTCALGFDYQQGGTRLSDFLCQQEVPFRAVPVDAPLRVNTKLFESETGRMTEINCKGEPMQEEKAEQILHVLEQSMDDTVVLVAAGSIPPGLPCDLYRKMIDMAHAKQIRVILDASGALLAEGIKAGPDLIKPNIDELTLLLGKRPANRDECIAASKALIDTGVGAVCLTLGSDGAFMVTKQGTWFSAGLDIPVRGVQGAGDSVVAGICAAMLKTEEPGEWLRSGVAAAHGSLIREGTLLCERTDYDMFIQQMPIECLETC